MKDFDKNRMDNFFNYLEYIIKGEHTCYSGYNFIGGYCPGCAKGDIRNYNEIISNKVKELKK